MACLTEESLSKLSKQEFITIPVSTRYRGDIGFLLGFYRDIDRLHIEIEVTLLCDIFFQHHNDVVAIT